MAEQTPYYKELADFVEEKATFDLTINEDGITDIHSLIAKKKLEEMGYTWFEIVKYLDAEAGLIRRNLNAVYRELGQRGKTVFRVTESQSDGRPGKKIVILTTDGEYQQARQHHIDRMYKLAWEKLDATMENFHQIDPGLADQVRGATIQRMSNQLIGA